VTTLPRVKKCTPSVPCACVSPNSELFQPPKEKYAIGTGTGHVDADHADLDLVLEAPGGAAVVGEDRRAVAVLVGVDQRERLVVRTPRARPTAPAEDLVGVEGHVRGDVVEQGRADEEAVAVRVREHAATVDDQRGTCGLAGVDVAGHPVSGGGGDQRPHVAAAPAVARTQAERALGDPVDEVVGDAPDRDNGGDRHAALARGAVPGVHGRVGGQVQVGVGQHDHVVLRAAQGLHPLAVRGAGLVDVAGDRRRADEGHRLMSGA
jgi:hypothetical protein